MKKLLLILALSPALALYAQKGKTEEKKEDKHPYTQAATYGALTFRSIGPAVTSGRVSDIAVNRNKPYQWYIAAASGGIWKTNNAGISFTPVFDGQGSYSIGCITLDPTNEHTVWVGTGENNNQRSVAYGDGVYKSEDGGKTWKNMGLKNSEHIGRIVVDPTHPNTVFVAAYGPLWSAGGDRGIYKTTDGGANWKQVLKVSENTGCNEVHMDPRNPQVLYATAHQRRRHEWTYISGGPESAIYKSTDGGETWNKLSNGLPRNDVGRIGMAISPVNPDYLYAIIEATEDERGFYRSTDRGASWEKRSGHATAGNYYTEIFADPVDLGRIYSMDTYAMVSNDGGKSFTQLGEKNKHVDNHALWVDPTNTRHLLIGCDGGLYESWDGAATWAFQPNLPITQFYRVAVDNVAPFYTIYGGTQDNTTLGGPSRTLSSTGITNSDWFVTTGGDGFETVVDPVDPNIVYSESQYGGLVRFDRRTGEATDIRPQEMEGEAAYRFNWDAPLLISHFSNQRIYFAAQKIFRSDDRGSSWKVISGDLSRGVDRNKLPVMGKVWSMDAVAKNQSTSIYGNITALAESPKNEQLLYAGTDDGLIHVTTDGGQQWKKISSFPGVPALTLNGNTLLPLVHNIVASQHDENVAYAVFNNHRNGDFKPYLLKTSDKGNTWTSISSNLPERGSVYCVAEDHKNPRLLFAGTEFGVYFTLDGGKNWMQLSSGLPTICVREMAIQQRENDLVLATFGRGFYVLDDYSVLQQVQPADLDATARVFPVKDGLLYNVATPFGYRGKGFQGERFYAAENPPPGATITWHLKEDYKTMKQKRKELEKERIKNGLPVYYPSADSIRMEDREEEPYILLVITDEAGNIVRRIKEPATKGMHRTQWNGRLELTSPVSFYQPNPDNAFESPDQGPLAIPGMYKIHLVKMQNGVEEKLTEPVAFNLITLYNSSITVDRKQLQAFNRELAEFRRVAGAVNSYRDEMHTRMQYIEQALLQSPTTTQNDWTEYHNLQAALHTLDLKFNGDNSLARREFETLPGFMGSLEGMVYGLWNTSIEPSGTYRTKLDELRKRFDGLYQEVKTAKLKLETLEKRLDAIRAPYTPGRFPEWK